MPSKTPAQARAMRSAAKGQSKLGIPAKVGRDFVKADVAKAHAKGKAKGKKRWIGKNRPSWRLPLVEH